jgi:hypothetical protein
MWLTHRLASVAAEQRPGYRGGTPSVAGETVAQPGKAWPVSFS